MFLNNVKKILIDLVNFFKKEEVKIAENIVVYESVSKAKKLEDEMTQIFVLAGLNGVSINTLKNLFKTKGFFRYNHSIHEILFLRKSDIWFSLRIHVDSNNRVKSITTFHGGVIETNDYFVTLAMVKNAFIGGEECATKD